MNTAKQESEQRDDGDLGGEGFGCRYSDLQPGMHVDASVAFSGDRAGNVVTDPEGPMALALAFAQGGERVRRLPALADHEHECVPCHRQIAVA